MTQRPMFIEKTMHACVVVLKQFHHFDWVIFGFSGCAKSHTAGNGFWVNMALFFLHSNIFWGLQMV